jgi:peptidoglycan/xylan/chitin deacetylase (PgdA/CDA1 family)
LCYHAVSPDWPAALSVTPAAFARQIEILVRRGYRGARFTDAIIGSTRGRVAVVTFDDNYRSVLEIAKPVLDRHGYPGTLYVPTGWPSERRPMRWQGIDRWLGTPHERELSTLSWAELRSLATDGWEIGSHTCTHPHLPALDHAALHRELGDSKARIEAELEVPCTSLAYPYGASSPRVVAEARDAGYLCAGTIPRVLTEPEPLLWPRVPIFHADNPHRYRIKISPTVRCMRSSAAGRHIDRARVRISNHE